ncbi:MAG: hypothetical protein FWC55_06540 [Firmicutes bacterium]|nr:hypothetical protein [Bacillota bacterium]
MINIDYPLYSEQDYATGRLPPDLLAVPSADRTRLRKPVLRKREAAESPRAARNRRIRTAPHDLRITRPPVYAEEVPRAEADEKESRLTCENLFARDLERRLARELYYWDHALGGWVLDGFIERRLLIYDNGFGESAHADVTEGEGIRSHRYRPCILTMDVDEGLRPRNYHDEYIHRRAPPQAD